MFVSRAVRLSTLLATATVALAAPAAAAPTIVGGIYPFAVGDVFTYQYDETSTVAGKATTVAYVTTTQIEPETTYAGVKAYPFHTTGTYKSSLGTATVNDVEYRNFVTAGASTRYASYGYVDSTATAEAGSIVYHQILSRQDGTPFLYDVLPEKASTAWAEPVAVIDKTDDYDQRLSAVTPVLTADLTRAADGSYIDRGVDNGVSYTRVVRSNGTGYDSASLSAGVRTWTYGLPVASGSAEVIPATETYAGTTTNVKVPDWYPSHAAPMQPLVTSAMYDLGKQTSPAQCGKRAGVAATRLELIYKQLDPVYGDTYDETQNYYVVPGIGRICRLDDIVETYYEQQSTGKVKSVTSTVSSEVLISENLK